MRNLTVILLTVLSLSACRNNDKILEVADNYVSENILPLFQSAQISDRVPFIEESYRMVNGKKRIVFYKKDYFKKLGYINLLEKQLLDRKKRQIHHNEQEFREQLLENEIASISIESVRKANSDDGFYIVNTAIKYREEKYFTFEIIVTKDFEVINTPIDTVKLYNR